MALISLILDSERKCPSGRQMPRSLLAMPLGCGTVLSQLSTAVRETGCTDIRVLPATEHTAAYERDILGSCPSGTKLVDADVVTSLVHEYEPSDHVLILNPRYWPIAGYDLGSVLRDAHDARWAIHGVAVASTPEGTQEHVHCDANGQVTKVFRYYEDVTCSHIGAMVHSLVPLAPSLEGVRFDSLSRLRSELTLRGMLSQDVPVRFGIIDLADEQGLLALNEQYVASAQVRGAPVQYTSLHAGTLVGPRCRIHPAARMIPPVVIQDEVTVEEGAVIVGPAVIGSGSTIRRGSLVAQSVLASGSDVPAGGIVRHRAMQSRQERDSLARTDGKDDSQVRFEPVRDQMVRLGSDSSVMCEDHDRGRSVHAFVKLIVDTAVAAVALVVLAPLFLVVTIAIKLDSRGPVLFGHEREGKGGRVFKCLKFRTMCEDAHIKQRELYSANALDGPQFKLDNDPRVTRMGQWLRATNIDELPQLINVFLGQMAIVGPRPSPFRENQICVPWRRARLSVRPGITGLWQICRDQRSEGDFHQWITYDIMYVRHMSFLLDHKILLATVLTLGGMWTVPHTWLVRDDPDETIPPAKAPRRHEPIAKNMSAA